MILVISQDEHWLKHMQKKSAYVASSMDVAVLDDVTIIHIDERMPYDALKPNTFIVITSSRSVKGAIKAYNAGALDYIVKDYQDNATTAK